ncbi:MCE family protein [Mycobacterium sp. 1423905.2]|uniref:MCE family protein n=1 Tax=Mycobacterium sp. 1423905.2 TaxID=1856859 RepID=UPI0007FF639B|nr:MCE family protein [Mycobacterium sp. 1423905.2]OBJ49813.1 MCE-family protein MCE1A [Mycobacterium sp. 1423905.2]
MDPRRRPPHKTVGLVAWTVLALVALGVYAQFRGHFIPRIELTMVVARAGLVMDPGSKVTYNGVAIGRVSSISEITRDGVPAARVMLAVTPKYIALIPANVAATVQATTVFGNKYVALTSPKQPAPQHITPATVIVASAVTTEFNTLFETLTSIAERVDPVKVNLTLSGAAQALTGMGNKFGAAVRNANAVLDQVNPRMPQVHNDIRDLAALADAYADAAPPLWDAADRAVTTARTLNQRQVDLDAALLAAAGLGELAADVFGRAGPYLTRGTADLAVTSRLLDEYSPEIFCTIRNYAQIAPRVHAALAGDNGYSLGAASGSIAGAQNPYVWPDNLPRINARGGPGGKPGCWAHITRELWPAPLLVMDVGASIVPYNHFEIPSPVVNDYVWGRQLGDYTINP